MSTATYVIGIVASALVIILIFELLRRRALKERHAVWWLIAGFMVLILAIFPQLLEGVSNYLGIEVPVNLVFFLGIAVLFVVNLQTSSEITKLEKKVERLAEDMSLLEERTRR